MSGYADELRSLVDELITREGPEAGWTVLWDRLRELELSRVGIPEEQGGSGGTLDDLLVLIEALAAQGVSTPLLEASVADWVLSGTGSLAEALTTVVLLDEPAEPSEGTLTAKLEAVPWARAAGRLLIAGPDGVPLTVDLRHPSVTITPGENLAGEPRDEVLLDGTPCAVAPAVGYTEIRSRLLLLWSTATAGAARGAYRLTKAYVVEREQFGAPLVKIPAVAANLATMRVHLVQAEAALALAREESAMAVLIARTTTAAAATAIARQAHQLHGAMGITLEYPLHRFTRRLWAWRDMVAGEYRCAEEIGAIAVAAGEEGVWTQLTEPGVAADLSNTR